MMKNKNFVKCINFKNLTKKTKEIRNYIGYPSFLNLK